MTFGKLQRDRRLRVCSFRSDFRRCPGSPRADPFAASGMAVLERNCAGEFFEPNLPDWQVVMGAAVEHKPLYDGAELTRTISGPVINIRYKGLWFASIGEGLGVNLWNGDHYRAGLALTYDLGRYVHDDVTHLTGLGDSRWRRPQSIHLVRDLEVFSSGGARDVRQIIGGADGLVADIDAYLPLPGSSKRFVMFAGPSYILRPSLHAAGIWCDDHPVDRLWLPVYDAHSGSDAMGASALAPRGSSRRTVLINFDTAINHLLGSAAASPITQRRHSTSSPCRWHTPGNEGPFGARLSGACAEASRALERHPANMISPHTIGASRPSD